MPPRHRDRDDRACIYLRQSTYREESVSLEQQETACRDYCAKQGYTVVAVASDPGVSATKSRLLKRKGIQAALQTVDDDTADVLVCWKLSRIARQRLDFELAKERIASAGGRLESATELNDTSPTGRFATGMLAEFAVFESAQISENWRTTHARRRNAGVPAQGGRRYGYTRLRDERGNTIGYEIDPSEASTLAWMYAKAIEGHGAASIAAELNRRNIPNPIGKPWAQRRVHPLLDSGFAAGLIVHRRRDNDNRPISDPVYHHGAHTAIITAETWEAYRAVRRQSVGRPARTVEARYPLTGLTRCGDCGASMWPARAKRGGPGHVLVCGQWQATRQARCVTVARHRAEGAVKDWLTGYVADLETQARNDDLNAARLARARRDEQAARRNASSIEDKLAKLNRGWLDGTVPDVGYAATRDELLNELKLANDDIQDAQDTHVAHRTVSREHAQSLLDDWHKLPAVDIRNTLRHLIDHVLITPPARPHGRSTLTVVTVFDEPAT